ncbi:MAG: PPC domain-containing DNA-binding protein [Elusimicrobiaceae bacterium]
MSDKPYLTGRTYLFKISKGDDLLAALEDFCVENQIKCGLVSGIGATISCNYGFYDQKKKTYIKHKYDGAAEILSLAGNVSLRDGRPMVHAHIMIETAEGKVSGGHLMGGTKVFASELFIQELVGEEKSRKLDKATGLFLWTNVKN